MILNLNLNWINADLLCGLGRDCEGCGWDQASIAASQRQCRTSIAKSGSSG